jgi:hypothetical protein
METGEVGIATELLPKIADLYQVDELDLFTFPALFTRHELIELTLSLPEESLQALLREGRKLERAARSATAAQETADHELALKHVRSMPAARAYKQPKTKAG